MGKAVQKIQDQVNEYYSLFAHLKNTNARLKDINKDLKVGGLDDLVP